MQLRVAALALLLASCARSGTVVEAPVEVAIPPLGKADAGVVALVERAAPAGPTCTLRLTLAGRIEKSSATCYLDERISRSAGRVRYPCNGDGPVEAEFGEHRYVGRATGGEVEIEMSTELDWDDGCHWGTRAVIGGTLVSGGAPSKKSLTWTYRDHVIQGSSCSAVCNASAQLRVVAALPTAREPDPDDD